jgi:hypothetical protein
MSGIASSQKPILAITVKDWSLAKIKIAAYRRIFCHELLELDKFSAQL